MVISAGSLKQVFTALSMFFFLCSGLLFGSNTLFARPDQTSCLAARRKCLC